YNVPSSFWMVKIGYFNRHYLFDMTLDAAIKKEYHINKLSLENRVIFIHGVPEGKSFPGSVKSLPGVPAYVTVPIACGEIRAL
ncbi:MAG TPA: hypothetical protein VFI29_23355, partial [Hanamia sp.]|nr:hypothetical protein [Hanamia sp.]